VELAGHGLEAVAVHGLALQLVELPAFGGTVELARIVTQLSCVLEGNLDFS
jgi:hypothetical protein